MKLTVENGGFSYENGTPVLSDISFSLEKGEVMAVLGANGIGKTTLLKCLTGLLPWTSGESYIDGEKISALRGRKLWQLMSYVPQARETNVLYTGEEMVLLGRSAHLAMLQSPRGQDVQVVDMVFKMLDIDRLRFKRCSKMSGGELQMLMIARALAAQTGIMVLDEPESGLDFRNQLVILNLLRSLSEKEGLTCVFNTHYPVHALRVAQKTLILGPDGHCVFGSSKQVVTKENLRTFFGVDVKIDTFTENGMEYSSMTPISVL